MTNALSPSDNSALAMNGASSTGLVLSIETMDKAYRMAELMASGRSTVPKHLQGCVADCMAVTLQALQWNMSPFAVAQKTHLVNGTLGYEAQLVNAVLQSTGAISGEFEYEYRGAGEDLECRVGAVPRGRRAVTWGEWLRLGTITTKNSPLWKTNPKQQIGYLQVKNWARLYKPGAILGVYTADELQDPGEKFMGQVERVDPAASAGPATLPPYPADKFSFNLPKWRVAIATGKATAGAVIDKASTVGVLSAAQEQAIRAPMEPAKQAPPQQPPPSVTDVQPKGEAAPTEQMQQEPVVTEQQIGDRMHRAATLDDLYTAADLIGEVADPEGRARLTQFFDERKFALESA